MVSKKQPRKLVVLSLVVFICGAVFFTVRCQSDPPAVESTNVESQLQQKANDEVLKQLEILAKVHFIDSKIMNERRQINVYVPPHYQSRPSESFPVIYLLDGAFMEDYHHVSGLVQFLTYYELMPPSILVGIANVDRYRDFTFPSNVKKDKKRLPTSGGSAKFRKFLAEEIQPFVASTYRVNDSRTLIGQSLGGLVASEILAKTPELFNHYLIVSPSFWWDGGSLLPQMDQSMANWGSGKTSVFLALGEEGPEMQAGVDQFVRILNEKAPAELTWHYQSLPEETHATILHRALYAGFEWMYGESHPGL